MNLPLTAKSNGKQQVQPEGALCKTKHYGHDGNKHLPNRTLLLSGSPWQGQRQALPGRIPRKASHAQRCRRDAAVPNKCSQQLVLSNQLGHRNSTLERTNPCWRDIALSNQVRWTPFGVISNAERLSTWHRPMLPTNAAFATALHQPQTSP